MPEFKDMLKFYRENAGMSQRELAKRLGVAFSTIGMYEQGKRHPDFEVEEKIADLFNVSLDNLRGRDSESPSVPILQKDEEQLLDDYRKLNDLGKNKTREYISDLKDNEKYTVEETLKKREA